MGLEATSDNGRDRRLVLAVDDEPANQRALRRALCEDCRVLTAGSGAEALALMEREPVALVITDQRMPGMSGAEFLARAVERHPRVVRIVLTGYGDVDTLIESINTGHVYHFLSKPWELIELRQVVRRGLERYAAELERERLLAELEEACRRERRESEQKSRLLAMTAHELGTPVHIVLNALELAAETEAPQSARAWLETARRASEWLARGVAQVHAAARVRQEHLRLRPQRVDLGDLLEAVAGDVRSAAAERRLDISCHLSGGLGEVVADPQWLRQAFANLLTNSVRFTPDGGAVRIEASAEVERVSVSVCDTGIGIAPEHLDEVFEPFSAAAGDPLRHGSGWLGFGARGLGLGLAMTRAVAEAHGGGVAASSEPGAGSRFTLSLPRCPPRVE